MLHGAIGMLAIAGGDSEMARTQNVLLTEIIPPGYKGEWVSPFLGPRFLATLARTAGDIDSALERFDYAVLVNRQAKFKPELAWSLADYAATLLDRGEAGDREKAVGLQDEALKITGDLKMGWLTERILSRRDILRA
jgi:tetratricopeptide (TPR) repeat protein